MPLTGLTSKKIVDLRGGWTARDQSSLIPANRASVAHNLKYLSGGPVETREGYATAGFSAGGKWTSLHHWLSSGGLSRIIYMESLNSVKMRNLVTGDIDTLMSSITGRGAVVAEAGGRAYIAVFTSGGLGATQVRIVNPLISGTPADKAFHPPLTFTSFTAADLSAGLCTAGTHKFGFIFKSRTGFTGRPSPAPADVFTPVSITIPANRTIRLSITLNTPAEAGTGSAIFPIMTRADNPNKWYYIPDFNVVSLPASASGWTQNFDISVSDEDLANRGIGADDPNDHFSYLAQVVAGTGPITPAFVATFGNRMVYGVTDAVTTNNPRMYISDPFNHQVITEDQHVVALPGNRAFYSARQLGPMLYVFGPRWTYGFVDGGNKPVEWPPPATVSGQIGSPSCLGVAEAGPDLLFVASESGLFPFTGQYPIVPLSEEIAEWDRINWAVPHTVIVATDPVRRRVYVAAPLDAATEPSHLLMFDYTRGLTPRDVDFSLDYLTSPTTFSSIAMVQDPTSNESVLWIGPSSNTAVLKQDASARADNGSAITTIWESGRVLTPGDKEVATGINKFRGASFLISGSGTATATAYNLNRSSSVIPSTISLASTPADPVLRKWSFNKENETIRVSTTGLNHWFRLDLLEPYWVPYLTNR